MSAWPSILYSFPGFEEAINFQLMRFQIILRAMRKYVLFAILFQFYETLAQNSHVQYKGAIKFYNVSSFEFQTQNTGPRVDRPLRILRSTLIVLHPAIAFQLKSGKKNFHEIELSDFSVRKQVDRMFIESIGCEVRTIISGRYEFILGLSGKSDKRLVPSLGFGLNPYFIRKSSFPESPASFNYSNSIFGFRTIVTPRINYYFSQRFFLDLNIPFSILDFEFVRSKNMNPAIPKNNQTITTFDYLMLPRYYCLRIGIGLKI